MVIQKWRMVYGIEEDPNGMQLFTYLDKTNLPHNDGPLSSQLLVICPLGRLERGIDEPSPRALLPLFHLHNITIVNDTKYDG